MKTRFQRVCIILLLLSFCFSLAGCKDSNDVKKLKDLDFTVVEDADLPEKLTATIQQKKENPFKCTYSTDNYLYIVQGYGAQKSGGYSISVDELFLTENAIYIKTNLKGPDKQEPVTQNITYPYVVVKIEYLDKPVVFQ